ncbi:MAG: hypothetical protein AAGU32_17180, partial [Bacillota bacterium]
MAKMCHGRSHGVVGALLLALVGIAALAGVWHLQQNTFSAQDWDNLIASGTYHEGITVDGTSVSG